MTLNYWAFVVLIPLLHDLYPCRLLRSLYIAYIDKPIDASEAHKLNLPRSILENTCMLTQTMLPNGDYCIPSARTTWLVYFTYRASSILHYTPSTQAVTISTRTLSADPSWPKHHEWTKNASYENFDARLLCLAAPNTPPDSKTKSGRSPKRNNKILKYKWFHSMFYILNYRRILLRHPTEGEMCCFFSISTET